MASTTEQFAFASRWARAGNPVAGGFSGGINGVALSASQTGQIPFTNPISGNSYLSGLRASFESASNFGALMVLDRLWHNTGIDTTLTTSQAISTPTWPARDANGATDGEDVLIWWEQNTGMTGATATLGYTNSAGVAGRSVTLTYGNSADNAHVFPLQAGDTGVSSVQSIQLSAGSAGSDRARLVAARVLAVVPIPNGQSTVLDALALCFPRLYDGAVPYIVTGPMGFLATPGQVGGFLEIAQG